MANTYRGMGEVTGSQYKGTAGSPKQTSAAGFYAGMFGYSTLPSQLNGAAIAAKISGAWYGLSWLNSAYILVRNWVFPWMSYPEGGQIFPTGGNSGNSTNATGGQTYPF